MKEKMNNFSRKMQQWMIGRYGTDEFSRFLFVLGILLFLISSLSQVTVIGLFGWIAIIYGYYRCLSKKITQRSRERDWYLRMVQPFQKKFSLWKRMWTDRKTFKYFKCPNCKKMVRVPRGKGKIIITCTNCRTTMNGKT